MTGTRRKEQREARTSSASEPRGLTVVSRVAESTDPPAAVTGPVTEARRKEQREARKKSPKREKEKKTKRKTKRESGKGGKRPKESPEETGQKQGGGRPESETQRTQRIRVVGPQASLPCSPRRRDALSLTVSVWSFYVLSTTDNCQGSKIGN